MDKLHIVVVSDSRGRLLTQLLNNYCDEKRLFRVIVKSGAGLLRLWNAAELEMKHSRVDILFLLGVVCDITDVRIGKRCLMKTELSIPSMVGRLLTIYQSLEHAI